MAQQPKVKPLQGDAFFSDGRGARPLEPGTVTWEPGNLTGQTETLPDGRRPETADPGRTVSAFAAVGARPFPALAVLTAASDPVFSYDFDFPFPLSRDDLVRGRERFNIFCAVCHDQTGNGRGLIVLRGFTPPPNLHTDPSRGLRFQGATVPLRDVPPGYIVDVISRGFGAMPEHAELVPLRDRWRIAGYVKALQLSQNVRLDDLPEELRNQAQKRLEAK